MKTPDPNTNLLRHLPSVSRLLETPAVRALSERLPATLLTDSARAVLDAARSALRAHNGSASLAVPTEDELAAQVVSEATRRAAPSLQSAVNATGIVLHTGLGRARLAEAACVAISAVATNHSLLEIERETGKRGSRRDHVRGLLSELTGVEDATVVNNCAGAVFLAVTTLAQGREVIISRGELVEIGGAFRMPDIIRASGATLVEVGTTNRTRLSDYANALTENTGLILRCHPSNFALVGFTEETPTAELVALGREHNIPVMDDQGSGALMTPEALGIRGLSGSLRESVRAGCDLVTASGDKLLGGPQAGLILGRRDLLTRITKHPLARALRVDKFTLAALEATLRLYRDPDAALREIPTLRYLTRTEKEIRPLAQRLATGLRRVLPADTFTVTLVSERSQVGGGSLPGEDLPTLCVSVQAKNNTPSPDDLAARLRRHTRPVFARIKDDALLFDPRTLEPNEINVIIEAAKAFGAPR
jgi:L-seryl-tRNA(Ser) seleniumtransferase